MPDSTDIVALARAWIGTPYHPQAALRGAGCDCIGLIRGVLADLGGPALDVPPYTADWSGDADREPLLAAARLHLREIPIGNAMPGDIVVFRWRAERAASHAAIIANETRIIHAIDRAPVCEVTLSPQWRRRIVAAFRFPEVA
ncbi:NlpC/P60 family protein [soil metagenome]